MQRINWTCPGCGGHVTIAGERKAEVLVELAEIKGRHRH